jgi:hypothetical protein
LEVGAQSRVGVDAEDGEGRAGQSEVCGSAAGCASTAQASQTKKTMSDHGYTPVFDQRYDEQFPCGFAGLRGRERLTLRQKPLWQMTAAEVIDALLICQIASDESVLDEAAGIKQSYAASRYRRLEGLVHAIIVPSWHEYTFSPDTPGIQFHDAIKRWWPGG